MHALFLLAALAPPRRAALDLLGWPLVGVEPRAIPIWRLRVGSRRQRVLVFFTPVEACVVKPIAELAPELRLVSQDVRRVSRTLLRQGSHQCK